MKKNEKMKKKITLGLNTNLFYNYRLYKKL